VHQKSESKKTKEKDTRNEESDNAVLAQPCIYTLQPCILRGDRALLAAGDDHFRPHSASTVDSWPIRGTPPMGIPQDISTTIYISQILFFQYRE